MKFMFFSTIKSFFNLFAEASIKLFGITKSAKDSTNPHLSAYNAQPGSLFSITSRMSTLLISIYFFLFMFSKYNSIFLKTVDLSNFPITNESLDILVFLDNDFLFYTFHSIFVLLFVLPIIEAFVVFPESVFLNFVSHLYHSGELANNIDAFKVKMLYMIQFIYIFGVLGLI